MYDREFKELVKIAVEKLKDESVLELLQKEVRKHGINRKEKKPLFRSLFLYR